MCDTEDKTELSAKIALSDGGQKKPAGKNPSGEKQRTRQEIWPVGTMAQALNSPSYEATQETIYLNTNALKNRVKIIEIKITLSQASLKFHVIYIS